MRAEERKAKMELLATLLGTLLADGSEVDQGNTLDEIMYMVVNIVDDEDVYFVEAIEDAVDKWDKEQEGFDTSDCLTHTEVKAMLADMNEDEWKEQL